MSTLEEEILATERAVASAAGALAEFWERSASELGLLEEYVPEPIAGTTATPLLEYVPSAIIRKPPRFDPDRPAAACSRSTRGVQAVGTT